MAPATATMQRQIRLALKDLVEGLQYWRVWYVLGISEVRQRYRRSLLGPMWVTLSTGIQAAVIGFLLGFLFGLDLGRYLPFLCISLVTWTFISGVITEGANCFIQMSSVVLQVKRPLTTYVLLVIWRNSIIYAHNIIIFIIAAAAFRIVPTKVVLLVPLALVVLVLNVAWMAMAIGLVSTRFRDVPLLTQNVFSVLLWLTPVYYRPEQLPDRVRSIIDLNPLTYILEVARGPFLNEMPGASTWITVLAITLFGWLFAFALLVRTRARVPFWL
jgi:ABC-type polysaccharide/polyol phosphate export permease